MTAAEPAVAAAVPSTRSRALNASAWTIATKPLGMGIQLVRSMVLTRLLFPEAFGLMALVGVVLQGLQMCSDVGIGPGIIRSPRGDDPQFLRTAWTVQVIRGAILWGLCCALAWPAAEFYGEPQLLALLPVAGLNVAVIAFNTTAWATCQREMRIARTTVVAHLAVLGGLGAVVLLAWWMRSVWALVLGTLVQQVLTLVAGHLFLPGIRHRFCWDRAAVDELVHFGKWVFVSTLLMFLAMQLDRAMLAKLIPLRELGVYSIALVVSGIPREVVVSLSNAVLLPVLSERVRAGTGDLEPRLLRARAALLRTGLVLCLGMAVVAPTFFRLAYDSRYEDAGWIAQVLAFSAWTTVLYETSGSALLALGESRGLACGNLCNVGVTVGAALVGFGLFGLPGFIVGYAVGTGYGALAQAVWLRRHGLRLLGQDARFTAAGLGLAALIALAEFGAARVFGTDGGWELLAAGLAAWAVLAWLLLRPVQKDLAPDLPARGLSWISRLVSRPKGG